MLYLIGLGVDFSLTERGRKAVEKSAVLVEAYTNWLPGDAVMERLIGKRFEKADRECIEGKGDELIAKAAKGDLAILIAGDPLSATTHVDLILRARKAGVKVDIIPNSSVFTAVARTGLQLYKFGKTASIPFAKQGFEPETPFSLFLDNQKTGAHTLFLLDMDPSKGKYLTVKEAIDFLLLIAKKRKDKRLTEKTLAVGCARLGLEDEEIVYGSAERVAKHPFKAPPYCLIIPTKLHFTEEKMLDAHRI
ncbi:MAG: diphthine synthase [Nanoarchaeota archaeon]